MLYDDNDPTVALFISEGAASRAAAMVVQSHSEKVSKALSLPHTRQGQMKGYKVLIHFKDRRQPAPLTNSDFERLH